MPTRRALDPYATLGVPRNATPLQVARAHRHLAKRHHPDLHEGATDAAERMRRINEAWSILSNPTQRADWDRAHPAPGSGPSGHWGASRSPIQPATPSSTRTWASWRATAAETRSAPRTTRPPPEFVTIQLRRPPPDASATPMFRDSVWAAVLVAAVFLLLLAGAIVAGRLAF